jgi:hypothetical protein
LTTQFNGAPVETSPIGRKADGAAFELASLPTGDRGTFSLVAEYKDVLPADNRGSMQVPSARIHRVVLAGSTDRRLAAALEADPHVRLSEAGSPPEATRPGNVLVLQATVPETLPAGPLLVINPRNGSDLWDIDGAIEHATIARQVIDSPILAGLDMEGIVLSQVGRMTLKTQKAVAVQVLAVSADDEPLLLAFERPNGRVVVLGGDPGTSELYQQVELPVLFAQATTVHARNRKRLRTPERCSRRVKATCTCRQALALRRTSGSYPVGRRRCGCFAARWRWLSWFSSGVFINDVGLANWTLPRPNSPLITLHGWQPARCCWSSGLSPENVWGNRRAGGGWRCFC